jgi:hypothetical protein
MNPLKHRFKASDGFNGKCRSGKMESKDLIDREKEKKALKGEAHERRELK